MLITVLIIFVIVFLVGMGFNRFSNSIRRQANRMSEVRLTEMTAQGLALAAVHKIQLDLLSDEPSDNHKLKKILAGARPSLGDTLLNPAQGKPDFSGITQGLAAPLKEQGDFRFSIYYRVDSNDFVPIASGKDSREKTGYIRLKIVTSYKNFDDEFNFACPVRVSSAWLPLLSRFNLFVNDSGADQDRWRFNLVKTKPDGDQLPGSPRPLILNNGFKLAGNEMMRVENYLARRVGWVYFGGDQPAILNLAQGTNAVGEFFHLFETWDAAIGQFVGFYETAYYSYSSQGTTGTVATVQWDKGIADEVAAGAAPNWFKMVEGTPDAGRMTSNSVFRLYGVDRQQSPTLVLGKVFRGMISARGYQCSPKNLIPAQIFQWVRRDQWPDYISFDTSLTASRGLGSVATMARDVLGLDDKDIDRYREKYASQATQQGYNASLAFIATNRVLADPYSNFSGWLQKVMQAKSSIDEMNRLPVKIGGYEKNTRVPDLGDLMQAAKTKIYMTLDVAGAEGGANDSGAVSLLDLLAQKGLFRKSTGTLSLQGWVLVKASSGTRLVIDQAVNLAGNGGIIIEHGDLLIARDIDGGSYRGEERSETPNFTLQILALDGRILLNTARVDACLAASEKVLFGKEAPVIRGALATGHYDLKNASAGAELYYNQSLAIEASTGADNLDLLGFKLNPTPVYIK